MSQALTDQSVTPVAQLLLACLTQEVARVPDPPRLQMLRTGTQIELMLSTLDDECCQGLAWVRVVSQYPSTAQFPQPDQLPARCAPMRWAVVLEMGVARCAPTPPADAMVTAAQSTAMALAVLDDAAAMRRALCCFTDTDPDRLWLAGQWAPLPQRGGCMGGSWTLTVNVDECDCPEVLADGAVS